MGVRMTKRHTALYGCNVCYEDRTWPEKDLQIDPETGDLWCCECLDEVNYSVEYHERSEVDGGPEWFIRDKAMLNRLRPFKSTHTLTREWAEEELRRRDSETGSVDTEFERGWLKGYEAACAQALVWLRQGSGG